MKIGIDVRVLGFKQIGGVATYTYNLIANLAKIDADNEYIIFHSLPEDFTFGKRNFRMKVIQVPSYEFFKEQLALTYEVNRGRLDIFHSPFYLPPIVRLSKTILTIHDLNPDENPELYQDKKMVSYFRKWRRKVARKTDRIITVSNYVKKKVENSLLIPKTKIGTIHSAQDEKFSRIANEDLIERIERDYYIKGDFLLYVGHIQPWKNLNRLIEAFALIKRRGIKEKLVLVGGKGWATKEIETLTKELGLKGEVTITDFVPGDDLPLFYQAASAFVFPSLMEGFGIPVLESMACGTPVVCSNVTSLPEVAGGAAIFFNPLDVPEMAEAIFRVLTDEGLRKDLVKKGLKRCKEFSWEKTAKETLGVYKEMAQ